MGTKSSIGLLTLINFCSAILGVLYSILQARIFGVSREIEVFFASQVILQVVIKLTQVGAFSSIFLPVYHQLKNQKGADYALSAFSVMINWLFICSIMISGIFWISAPALVNTVMSGFNNEDVLLGLKLFNFLLLILPVQIVNSILVVPFNAEKIYGRVEIIGVLNYTISISLVLALYQQVGIWSLAYALAINQIISVIIKTYLYQRQGFKYQPILKLRGFKHLSIVKLMFNSFIYGASSQIFVLVLTAAATHLNEGYYGIYKYTQNMFSKVQGIALRPVTIVFFTNFSESLSNRLTPTKLRTLTSDAVMTSFIYAVLLISITYVSGEFLLSLLWGPEKFGISNILIGKQFIVLFSFMLFFSSLNQLYSKINLSYGKISAQYLGNALTQLISALLIWVLIGQLGLLGLMIGIFLNIIIFDFVTLGITYSINPKYLIPFEMAAFVKVLLFAGIVTVLLTWIKIKMGITLQFELLPNALNLALFSITLTVLLLFFFVLIKLPLFDSLLPRLKKYFRI